MEIEDKLVIAKLMDKINLCKTRNKIVNTEFLTIYQRDIIQKELNKNKVKMMQRERFLLFTQKNLERKLLKII